MSFEWITAIIGFVLGAASVTIIFALNLLFQTKREERRLLKFSREREQQRWINSIRGVLK